MVDSRYPHRPSTSHPAGTAILIELRCSQAVQPFDRHRNVDFVASAIDGFTQRDVSRARQKVWAYGGGMLVIAVRSRL
ncbi:Uncharacterised protein [Mycobacteroides abscessus subsp. abscessus]|nr:Uncharacterised protein [Mycobacteroides abscessus subsp. abscessus]